MAKKVARLHDTGSHGGRIVTASATMTADGRQVARVGDLYACPLRGHGVNPIKTGSSATLENEKIACVGSVTQCGSVIQTGSDKFVVD